MNSISSIRQSVLEYRLNMSRKHDEEHDDELLRAVVRFAQKGEGSWRSFTDDSGSELPVGEMVMDDRPVKLVGVHRPIAGMRNFLVPEEHRNHALVKGRYFYTIPKELLESVFNLTSGIRPTPGISFDEDLLEMEKALSVLSDDHSSTVGIWQNTPISCNLLVTKLLVKSDYSGLSVFGKTEAEIEEFVRDANTKLTGLKEIACGYAGWLMTNPLFVEELRTLASAKGEQLLQFGTFQIGWDAPSLLSPGALNPTQQPGWEEYESAVLEFCVRWRLSGLAGPRIPVPMQPMMAGDFPVSILPQLRRAGGLFNWPDTYPVYARDELRELLVGALQNNERRDHLEGWHSIIAAGNKAKNQIGRFERLFRFQHFWKLLKDRHPSAFEGRIEHMDYSFAQYLGVAEGSIKSDRRTLRKRLGPGWDEHNA